MCFPVQCNKCGKTTWAGCGAHADMVMSRVPANQRCTCGSGPARMTYESKEMAKDKKRLVVVDFFATWCGPCKMMAPKFEAMSRKYTSATFMKINGDECPMCVDLAGVTAFPTFQLYKGGKLLSEIRGIDEPGLRRAIEANI
eukprot:m51a1_g3845 putative trx2p (142) ;mRNA; f:362649-363229